MSTEAQSDQPDQPVVRKLLPKRHARERPEWDVELDGHVIGRISEKRYGKASAVFYYAVGVHPETGRTFPLESTTDFDERVRKIYEAHFDLDRFNSADSWGHHSWWPPLETRMRPL